MNPRNLSASDILVWGIVLHLIADWPFQTDWMAKNKQSLRHPAGYFHAAIHGVFLSLVFGWVTIPLAVLHLLIDTRKPVAWWGKLVGQTQPANQVIFQRWSPVDEVEEIPVYDMGMEVRIWVDQVFHIICIAVAALLVT
jgi:hypothetical protein